METPTNVVRLRHPEDLDDPLTEVLRSGARRLLAQAVEMEADAFLSAMQDLRLQDGRARLVRHGHGPERAIQTGIGPVPVARVRVRDRGASGSEDRVRFTSTILPKWARRTRSLDALLPVLYLRGVSTGDFQDALAALLGRDAPNLSPAVIARLTAAWADEYARWQGRDLSARRYAYVWADGVYLQARMEEQAECMLVLIGATPEVRKELVGFQVGVRESAQSWRELLVDVKRRGLSVAPTLAVGDGALARHSGGALGSSANDEPDRERLRDGASPHGPREGRLVARHREAHGLQTGDGGVENMAPIEGRKSVAESHSRGHIQGWNRSRAANQKRRLIHAVTHFPP